MNSKDTRDNYEVLTVLGRSKNLSCYKVKNKKTNEIQVWRAIDCKDILKDDFVKLENKISQYKQLNEDYYLKIYGHLQLKEQSDIIYLITEYSTEGSLLDLIKNCHLKNTYFTEDFIWKFLYQASSILKSLDPIHLNKICCDTVFVGIDNNIKVFVFQLEEENESEPVKDLKIILGELILSMSTLEVDVKKRNFNKMCNTIFNYYSTELIEIISFILKKETTLDEVINGILCHPKVLSKSMETVNNLFVEKAEKEDSSDIVIQKSEISHSQLENVFNEKIKLQLENIRNREIILKNQEQKLMEKEFELKRREKKVTLMEKLTAEKHSRAELYLKTAKEKRTAKPVINNENTDASFSADCGDSSILPTSCKLNLNNFKKPSSFTRTFSERHVRFKGHSPLKEKDYRNGKKVLKSSKLSDLKPIDKNTDFNSWLTLSSSNNSEVLVDNNVSSKEKGKSLFSSFRSKSNKNLLKENKCEMKERSSSGSFNKNEFRPISWTEDNKKQAFELLKIINSVNVSEKNNVLVKHTDL